MDRPELKKKMKKLWWFIWEDNSIWSWLVNIVLAFVLIKFLVYPGLGLLFGTGYPIVAVVSGSMEHDGSFNKWWNTQADWYTENGIAKDEFSDFSFKNGFNKGDIMILYGKKAANVNVGDVIVFKSARQNPRPDPIIHRVVKKWEKDGQTYYQTKGDHNPDSINGCSQNECLFEGDIREDQYLGNALVRIPFLGYIKIWFVELLGLFVR
ncbi:MAG TPA: signal peptidase I [Candidatus Nanoarchaeia archaeon]|nr:signal peptidase I [Candidatus Nanoarchaeia archaeon]